MGKEAFFRAGLFFVAATAAEAGVVLVGLDGVEEGDGLEFVARGVDALLFDDAALVDGPLDGADDELGAELFNVSVAVSHRLVEIVSRVDVDERERKFRRPERLVREVRHEDGILAAGKEEGRLAELRGGLAEDENGLGLELIEMA